MGERHIAIIGCGPIGIEMALSLVGSGNKPCRVVVFEKGPEIASNIQYGWGHVTLFSSNGLNCSKAGLQALSEMKADIPNGEEYVSAATFVDQYLKPLKTYLVNSGRCEIMFNTNVVSVGRKGLSKGSARKNNKFLLLVEVDSVEQSMEFDFVVDASGSYSTPNFIGQGGNPAMGERQLRKENKINYYIPDHPVLSMHGVYPSGPSPASDIAGWVTVVIGAGASAITSIKKCLARNKDTANKIIWITHTAPGAAPYARIVNDPLPQRDVLNALGNSLAEGLEATAVIYKGSRDIVSIEEVDKGANVSIRVGLTSRTLNPNTDDTIEADDIEYVVCNEVIANVGYRPDKSLLEELQVHYCYASDGPMKLAAAMVAAAGGGGSGDCLAQVLPGKETMNSPEPRLFIIGISLFFVHSPHSSYLPHK